MTAPIPENTITGNQKLIDRLKRFARFEDLRRSEFYREQGAELRRLLDEPRVYEFPDARPRLRTFLRVVEWNIERGARLTDVRNRRDRVRWRCLRARWLL